MLGVFQQLTDQILHPRALGLDISDLSVKFCLLEKRGQELAIESFGEARIPQGVIVTGEIKKPDELVEVLRNLKTTDGKKLGVHYCVASLPEEQSFVRLVQMPNLKTEDMGRAIQWEVEGVIPLPLAEIFFDYGVLSGVESHRDVLITAFGRTTVNAYHDVLRRAGFIPLALEVESQAISRALVGDNVVNESCMVIDMGAMRTSFIIIAGGVIIFTRSILTGGHDFDQSIAAGLNISEEEAQKVKIEAGLDAQYAKGNLVEILQPHLEALRGELIEQLEYFRGHPQQLHPEFKDVSKIILCGGDANLLGLERYLATSARRPAELGNPFIRFGLSGGSVPQISKNNSLKYTTAIGLALRGIGR